MEMDTAIVFSRVNRPFIPLFYPLKVNTQNHVTINVRIFIVSLIKIIIAYNCQALYHRTQSPTIKFTKIMSITLKTPEEFAKMRVAGKLAANVLEMIGEYIKPGVTTNEINDICHKYITQVQQAIPAPLNYPHEIGVNAQYNFPKSVCTSVNHVVCHGIPNDKPLQNGDIVNVDVTVIKDGYHGDTSKMFIVGEAKPFAQKLITITQECLYLAIRLCKPGVKLGDIGFAIQEHAEKNRYSVVREYCGHGIGKIFHEDPQVLHYGKKDTGIEIQKGMTFTIEPMINMGKRDVKLNKIDNWTVITKDHSLSAQWEHTLGVTDNGVEVFTLRNDETIF
jgi:methionyl aminopeptidase